MEVSIDYAEFLAEEARSDVAVLHEFKLRFSNGDTALHLFFEGDEDGPYYLPEIRKRAHARPLWAYVCGGKPKLKVVRDSLRSGGYDLDRCLFFVDRDYDDYFASQISSDSRTHITDYYSVESYIVSRDAAECILLDLSGFARDDADFKLFEARFDACLIHFAELIRPLIALSLAAREKGGKPNFNNINLSNIFNVSPGVAVARKAEAGKAFSKAVFPKGLSVDFQDLLRWTRRLKMSEHKLWLRGKYELWFFEKVLLNFIENSLANRKARRRKLVRVPSSLREGALFDVLGGRIKISETLEAFLGRCLLSATAIGKAA